MKKLNALITLVIPLALAGCASETMALETTATPGTSVANYGRYYLQVAPAPQSDARHWAIEKAIHDDLRAKGYTPVDLASADIVVRYDLNTAEHLAKRHLATNAAPPPEGDVVESVTVTIEQVDLHRAIWEGRSSGDVAPSHLTQALDHAIHDILARIPRAQPRVDHAHAALY